MKDENVMSGIKGAPLKSVPMADRRKLTAIFKGVTNPCHNV